MARASEPANTHHPREAREFAASIVVRLREAGHTAYFAGGCVRDELLGLSPTDFDVATDATPARVQSIFTRTTAVGAAFGVVLVHQEGSSVSGAPSVEVATFRSDGPYTDARRPDVVHFSDAKHDAERRDFTINAVFLDPLAPPDSAGHIIDFVGGRADLEARVLRAVGDPDKRLAEDHLRALRAVRFASRLGFTIEPRTEDAIRRHASELRGVSRERIGDELRRIAAHPSRAAALALLQRLTLDSPVLDEPHLDCPLRLTAGLTPAQPQNGDKLPRLGLVLAAWTWDRLDAAPDSAATLGARLHDLPLLARRWRAALCLSNQEHTEFSDVLEGLPTLLDRWGEMRVSAQKRAATAPWFHDSLRLVQAANRPHADHIRRRIKELREDGVGLWPPALVSGDDLVAAGLKPGPAFKRVLDEVLDAQLEGKVKNPAQAMELARRLYV